MYVRKIVVPLEADVLTAKARDFSDRRWHSHDTGWLKIYMPPGFGSALIINFAEYL